MAVDLFDYIPSLKREVTPPGSTLFSDVGDDTWVGYMSDAFWDARLDGFLGGYTCSVDGTITSTSGGDDITRDLVGLVVLYAGIKVLRNRIMNLDTSFRAAAGPVEFEVQKSANLLTEMLKQLKDHKDRILDAVNLGPTETYYFDGYTQRNFDKDSYFGERDLEYLAGLVN